MAALVLARRPVFFAATSLMDVSKNRGVVAVEEVAAEAEEASQMEATQVALHDSSTDATTLARYDTVDLPVAAINASHDFGMSSGVNLDDVAVSERRRNRPVLQNIIRDYNFDRGRKQISSPLPDNEVITRNFQARIPQ